MNRHLAARLIEDLESAAVPSRYELCGGALMFGSQVSGGFGTSNVTVRVAPARTTFFGAMGFQGTP